MSFLRIRNARTSGPRSPSPRPGSQKGQGHLDADTAYAAAITALGITKEVGELLKDIPYVKGVVGTVLQIIKIGEEIKQNRERCAELTEVVRKHTITLLRSLDKVSQSPQKDQLKELEEDLSRYKSLLESIAKELCKLTNWRFRIDRSKVLDDLQRCERELNSFHQDFTMTRLSGIEAGIQRQTASIRRHTALDHLLFTRGASWRSDSGCLGDTRKELRSTIHTWIEAASGDSPKIFCLSAAAGAGKSAVAHSVAERAKDLVASAFFVTRASAERRSLSRILGTLIWELAGRSQRFGDAIGETIDRERALASADPVRQFTELLLPSIRYLDQSKPFIWIIDALDELEIESSRAFIDLLRHHIPKLPGNFRILITFRPLPVFNVLGSLPNSESEDIHLQSSSGMEDIELIARNRMQTVAFAKGLAEWPKEDAIKQFTKKSEGLPIWVTVISAFLLESSEPRGAFSRLLEQRRSPSSPDNEVDSLYQTVLDASGNWKEESFVSSLPLVLGILLLVQRPLSVETIQCFYQERDVLHETLPNIVHGLRPFLTTVHSSTPTSTHTVSPSDPLEFVHLTVRDYLLGQTRVKILLPKCQNELALRCLQALNSGLTDHMLGVGWLNDENLEGIPTIPNDDIPEFLRYSSEFWIHHLTSGDTLSQPVLLELEGFLFSKLLLWTEFQTSTSRFQTCLPVGDFLLAVSACETIDSMLPVEISSKNSGDHATVQSIVNLINRPDFSSKLMALSARFHFMNRLEEALSAIEQAVELRRSLASERPAVFNGDLASSLNNLSNRLSNLGRREQALSAIEQAVELRRSLASERPAVFNGDLASSLNNLSNCLSDLGRREEALSAIEQAVELYRSLASERPAVFNSDLADSLNNLSNHLSGLGRREEALSAIEQAVELYRSLASERPVTFNNDLAMSLNNLSNRLSELGRREEALSAIEQAVELRRSLASERPAVFNSGFANSLYNLSNHLSDLGRREEALSAIEQAVELYRSLASERPAVFNSDLADSLNNLSNHLSGLGRREEALSAIEQAVELYRSLASERPVTFNNDLAMSLNNLSNHLSGLGCREEALSAIEQAVELYHSLASERPVTFNNDLAMSLNNLSNHLSDLGRREEALSTIKQAVKLYRSLASERPGAFNSALAKSLNNLSNHLSDLGHREEALSAIEQAVELYHSLASERPVTFNNDLAMSLNNLSNHLSDLGRREEALSTIKQAVKLYRSLASERPGAFNSALAKSLNNLSSCLSDLGHREEALSASEQAVELRRSLASERPAVFNSGFANSLYNLSNHLSDLGHCEQALSTIEQAVELYRSLASERPAAFNGYLATSLNNLSNRLSDLGRREQALAATSEAKEIAQKQDRGGAAP